MTKTKLQLLTIFTLATGGGATAFAQAPRTLAGGRPACGNTMTKGGSRKNLACERAEAEVAIKTTAGKLTRGAVTALLAIADADAAAVAPRRLANGRPACGNTNAKSSCTMVDAPVAPQVAVRK